MHQHALSVLCLSFCACSGVPSAAACPGDLNADGIIDSEDLGIVLNAFGRSLAGDANCDGTTDTTDLAIVLGAFGQSCAGIVPDELPFDMPMTFEIETIDFPTGIQHTLIADFLNNGRQEIVTLTSTLIFPGQATRMALSRTLDDGALVTTELPPFTALVAIPELLAVDINGDGLLDIATADTGFVTGNSTGVWLVWSENLGGGEFAAPQALAFEFDDYPAVVSDAVIAAIDLTNNGRVDIVLAHYEFGMTRLTTLLAPDNGMDWTMVVTDVPGQYIAMAAGQLDVDGYADLVLISLSGDEAVIAHGHADGTFSLGSPFPVRENSYAIEVADMNRDGLGDLVITHTQQSYLNPRIVTVQLNDAADGFTEVFARSGTFSRPPQVVDVDGDCNIDLIWSGFDFDPLKQNFVLRNDGNANFQTMYPEGVRNAPDIVADINGDGLVDYLHFRTLNSIKPIPRLAVVYNTGSLHFATHPVLKYERGLKDIRLIDIDGNGIADLVGLAGYSIVDPSPGAFLLMRRDANGEFLPTQEVPIETDFQTVFHLLAGDLSGNGTPDLITMVMNQTEPYDNSLAVVMNDGKGGFGSTTITPMSSSGGIQIPAVADLNADGREDVVFCNMQTGLIDVLLSVGDGSFVPGPSVDAGGYAQAIAAGDLHNDGVPRIIARAGDGISIIAYDPDTGEHSITAIPLDAPFGNSSIIELGDLNLDGFLDIAVLMRAPDQAMHIIVNDGMGGFMPPVKTTLSPGMSGANTIAFFDHNGNGLNDIAIREGDRITLLRSIDGMGHFEAPLGFAITDRVTGGSGDRGCVALDVNNDGAPELLVTTSDTNPATNKGGAIRAMLNRTTGK